MALGFTTESVAGMVIMVLLAGHGEIIYPGPNGARYAIKAGSCFLFRMHEWHEGLAKLPLQVHAIAFTCTSGNSGSENRNSGEGREKEKIKVKEKSKTKLSNNDQQNSTTEMISKLHRHRLLRRGDFVQGLIDRSIDCWQDDSAAAQAWLQSALRAIAEEDARPQLSGKALAQDEAVRAFQARIRSNLAHPWSSADCMTALDLGREQSSRVFRRLTGQSFTSWVNRCRMERAAHLLRFSSLTVHEVSHEIGFADPYFFLAPIQKISRQRTAALSPANHGKKKIQAMIVFHNKKAEKDSWVTIIIQFIKVVCCMFFIGLYGCGNSSKHVGQLTLGETTYLPDEIPLKDNSDLSQTRQSVNLGTTHPAQKRQYTIEQFQTEPTPQDGILLYPNPYHYASQAKLPMLNVRENKNHRILRLHLEETWGRAGIIEVIIDDNYRVSARSIFFSTDKEGICANPLTGFQPNKLMNSHMTIQ